MKLYLIRHAHAVTEQEDPVRPLSLKGETDARRVAAWFRLNHALQPAQFWHSPLVRARATACLLAAGLGGDPLLVETPDLLPDDDPDAIVTRLAEYPQTHDIALVGHEPHLSALATLLVRGRPKPVAFKLRKGAIIALESNKGTHKRDSRPRWRIRWHFSPELLPPPAP
ncbi:phosphohistidine phosphatase SixA [Opitutaceae bacterium]